jgi:hypothetical protein
LRRNGVSYSDKFGIIKPSNAIFSLSVFGPMFRDIYLQDNSNVSTGSFTDFDVFYALPDGYLTKSYNSWTFLTGNLASWLTTEIEVFQIYSFDSAILTPEENLNLAGMTRFNQQALLLYRATRDGFDASSFHSKCDGKANTVTIIKTDSNYVFGGYA